MPLSTEVSARDRPSKSLTQNERGVSSGTTWQLRGGRRARTQQDTPPATFREQYREKLPIILYQPIRWAAEMYSVTVRKV